MKVADVMTSDPVVCPSSSSLADAAKAMRDRDIGDVLVSVDGRVVGILTDRDIVVRGLVHETDPRKITVGDIATRDVWCVADDADVAEAAQRMQDAAVRRLAVVDNEGQAVGIVSLGDLAVADGHPSALGTISATPPNN